MNARLYDPLVHRFLQTDNYIQDGFNTQNYNRYGYVLNNPFKYVDYSGNSGEDAVEPGNGCIDCGTYYNLGQSLALSWDELGIKDWSNRNLNFNKFSDGFKSAGNFIEKNVNSIGKWFQRNIDSIFGNKVQSLPSAPGFSGHQLSNGWQNEGISRSDKIIMNTIKNDPALFKQYNRILAVHPKYYLKYVPELRNQEAYTKQLNSRFSNTHNSYTEIYKASVDKNGKLTSDPLKYIIMHEFGHVWSSISGYRASNFKTYPVLGAQLPIWLDEIYADLYAQYWGGWPLTSQSYNDNFNAVSNSQPYLDGLIKFPKKF